MRPRWPPIWGSASLPRRQPTSSGSAAACGACRAPCVCPQWWWGILRGAHWGAFFVATGAVSAGGGERPTAPPSVPVRLSWGWGAGGCGMSFGVKSPVTVTGTPGGNPRRSVLWQCWCPRRRAGRRLSNSTAYLGGSGHRRDFLWSERGREGVEGTWGGARRHNSFHGRHLRRRVDRRQAVGMTGLGVVGHRGDVCRSARSRAGGGGACGRASWVLCLTLRGPGAPRWLPPLHQ